MRQISELQSLLKDISLKQPNTALSIRLILNAIGLSQVDGIIWIEKFGDPLTSLSGAKALIEQLGFDWHEAMSAGAAAIEDKEQWLLHEVAPHSIAWALSCLIEEQSSMTAPRTRGH